MRKYFRSAKPDYLTATCIDQADRATVRRIKEVAKNLGVSNQQVLLMACREFLSTVPVDNFAGYEP